MKKHVQSCVDRETGAEVECRLPPGANYVACDGNGESTRGLCEEIGVCPNQPDCDENDEECLSSRKFCRQYTILAAPDDVEDTNLGYIPLTNHCHDIRGQFSQEVDMIIDPLGETRSNEQLMTCQFRDGSTVNRSLSGSYAACGDTPCATTFVGGYESVEYDPRYVLFGFSFLATS